MASTDLYDLARELLTAAGEALADAPGGEISEPFVSPGLPAFDFTPLLTVHVGGPQVADTYPLQPPLQPSFRVSATGALILVQMTITVTRNVPIIDIENNPFILPLTVDMDAAAQLINGDLWAIWNYLATKHRAGDLFAADGGMREFRFLPAVSIHPQGGHGGWEIPVEVQLGGYDTEA